MDLTTCNENEPANPPAGIRESAVDEATGMARTVVDEAARVGEPTARASADVFGCNTETAQDTLYTAAQSFRRVADQVTQVLGSNGSESEEQTRRVSQNLQAVTQASTVLVRGAQEVSRELIGLVLRSCRSALPMRQPEPSRLKQATAWITPTTLP